MSSAGVVVARSPAERDMGVDDRQVGVRAVGCIVDAGAVLIRIPGEASQ